ncbi:MAG: hypothetical protein GF401_12115 [Chitinivibrionales bacterium]|nr:hypothetical protein [Chitinivibrionales bacterium]
MRTMVLFFLSCASTALFAQEDTGIIRDPDLVMLTRFVTADVRSEALAGAGCALFGGITTAHINPALPNAFNKQQKIRHCMVNTGYSRDSLFTSHNVPAGISCYLGEPGTIGILFRYLKQDDQRRIHEGVFNYSGRMFDKSIDQGAVDFGINLRYERLEWQTFDHDSLYRYTYRKTSIDSPWTVTRGAASDETEWGKTRAQRLIFDLGFVQKGIADRLDFGLTFHDLLGYSWIRQKPHIGNKVEELDSTLVDTINNGYQITHYTDSLYYVHEYKKSEEWIPSKYKRLTVGIAYHPSISQNNVQLSIPADLGFIGLFDKETQTRFTLRVGVEANFLENYYLRFGFARAPRVIYTGDLDGEKNMNTNIFTGGGGLRLHPFSADISIGKDSWGVGIGIVL